jgi:hypothetical protein
LSSRCPTLPSSTVILRTLGAGETASIMRATTFAR